MSQNKSRSYFEATISRCNMVTNPILRHNKICNKYLDPCHIYQCTDKNTFQTMVPRYLPNFVKILHKLVWHFRALV